MNTIEQGDILNVEKIGGKVLVVSKNFFNKSEQVIACPIVKNAPVDPLHIPVSTKDMEGIVVCEQMKLLDLRVRGYKKISEIKFEDIINITDAIQSIFDYYSYQT